MIPTNKKNQVIMQIKKNQGSDNIPTLRFPEFKDNWEMKKLGEVAETFSGGTPLTTKRQYFGGNEAV